MSNSRVIYPADPRSEFYTPRSIREPAWELLGERPTFDPCTSARNPMCALHFRTATDNRRRVLVPSEWLAIAKSTARASLWMNCPYGKNPDGTLRVVDWLDAVLPLRLLCAESLFLMPARPGAQWYSALTRACQLRCELDGRARFETRHGRPLKNGARWGVALFYFGDRVWRAKRLLDRVGVATQHTRRPRSRARILQDAADSRQLVLVR